MHTFKFIVGGVEYTIQARNYLAAKEQLAVLLAAE